MKSAETLKRELIGASDRIDKQLDDVINSVEDRERVSAAIKDEFRTLIVTIAKMVFEKEKPEDFNSSIGMECIKRAIKYCAANKQYSLIDEWYKMSNAAHHDANYQVDEGTRTFLPIARHVPDIKQFVLDEFGIEIIKRFQFYPLDLDEDSKLTYSSLLKGIKNEANSRSDDDERYVVTKHSFRHLDGMSFYEVGLAVYGEEASKYTSFLAFSIKEIKTPYPIRVTEYKNVDIVCLGIHINVMVILDYVVAIPYKILNDIAVLSGLHHIIQGEGVAYGNLMRLLTDKAWLVLDLLENEKFEKALDLITGNNPKNELYLILSGLKRLIEPNSGFPFRRTLRYLLCSMRESTVKSCRAPEDGKRYGDSFFCTKCYTFEKQPLVACLPDSITSIPMMVRANLLDKKPETEIPMRLHRHPAYSKQLFIPIQNFFFLCSGEDEKAKTEEIAMLVNRYNNTISNAVKSLRIGIAGQYLYSVDKVQSILEIREHVQQLRKQGVLDCSQKADLFLKTATIDDPAKQAFLRKAFVSSKVALLHGPAGTGKSKTIELFCEMMKDDRVCFVANANAALGRLSDTLRKRANTNCWSLKTFLCRSPKPDTKWVIFDECSVISNRDITRALRKCIAINAGVIFAGDPEQLEPVDYGGWFGYFVHEDFAYNLANSYRTGIPQLRTLWNRVRDLKNERDIEVIRTILAENHIVHPLCKDIVSSQSKHDVILCLNYEGIYGINFLNRLLQSGNPENVILWRQRCFKKNDPVIFTSKNFFADRLDESVKGQIDSVTISDDGYEASFKIRLDKPVDESPNYKVVQENGQHYMIVIVNKRRGGSHQGHVKEIPFQTAYAISIHKSQGLEYDDVGIVISKNMVDFITKNVFYTAITRAKKDVSIYWSPETEVNVLEQLVPQPNNDYQLLESFIKSGLVSKAA